MRTAKAEKNIVFMGRYNLSEKLSGPEKVAKRIFTEHTQKNKAIFIQYFFDGRKYNLYKKLFGIGEQIINENGLLYTCGLFKTYGLLRQLRPDLIHIIMFERFTIIALLYKLFNNVKIIYNEHGVVAYENSQIKETPFFQRFKDKFCEKRLLKGSDKVIFVSPIALNLAEKLFSFSAARAIIAANGIDDIFHNKKQKDFTQKPKAVFIYHNELYKSGMDFLLNFLNEYGADLELYIITENNLPAGITANVVKPMDANELAEFYNDKHIFLALNAYDTFSISTVEAMASGLVPVITGETGASRYIENGYNGFIINYGNISALSDAVSLYRALSQDAKQRMSQNAAEMYNELKWENVYSSYSDIYKNVYNQETVK